MEVAALILSIVNAVVVMALGFALRSYFPAYLGEKAKNLASKEDIREITEKIEGVKVEFKQHEALLENRRAVYENVTNSLRIFIAGHQAGAAERDQFLTAYASAWLWAPDQVLAALNEFIDLQQRINYKTTPEAQKILKASFSNIILQMRRDVVSKETRMQDAQYAFVQF